MNQGDGDNRRVSRGEQGLHLRMATDDFDVQCCEFSEEIKVFSSPHALMAAAIHLLSFSS